MHRFTRTEEEVARGFVFCLNNHEYEKETFLKIELYHAKERAPPAAMPRVKTILSSIFSEAKKYGEVHDRLCDEDITPRGDKAAEAACWEEQDKHLNKVLSLMHEFAGLHTGRRHARTRVMLDLWRAIEP